MNAHQIARLAIIKHYNSLLAKYPQYGSRYFDDWMLCIAKKNFAFKSCTVQKNDLILVKYGGTIREYNGDMPIRWNVTLYRSASSWVGEEETVHIGLTKQVFWTVLAL